MLAKLKKLKSISSKSGFTLVECIVAIGLLSVMSLMVCSILSAAVKLKAENANRESEIGEQVEGIVKEVGLAAESLGSENYIKFYSESGTSIDTIGGSDGVKANKEYSSSAVMQIGSIDYNFDDYEAKIIEQGGGVDGGKVAPRVYGGADVNGKVTISRVGEVLTDDIYTIVWRVNYKLNSVNESQAMKILCPIGATLSENPVTWWSGRNSDNTLPISERAVRVYTSTVGSTIEFDVTFTISKQAYDDNYKSFANYMKDKLKASDTIDTASSVQFHYDAAKDAFVL